MEKIEKDLSLKAENFIKNFMQKNFISPNKQEKARHKLTTMIERFIIRGSGEKYDRFKMDIEHNLKNLELELCNLFDINKGNEEE
jgi:hypothetical protein